MNMNHDFYSTLNEGEQGLVNWQYKRGQGHFMDALWTAIRHADLDNLYKLEKAFPLHVKAYRKYISEAGYWGKIQKGLFPE